MNQWSFNLQEQLKIEISPPSLVILWHFCCFVSWVMLAYLKQCKANDLLHNFCRFSLYSCCSLYNWCSLLSDGGICNNDPTIVFFVLRKYCLLLIVFLVFLNPTFSIQFLMFTSCGSPYSHITPRFVNHSFNGVFLQHFVGSFGSCT